MIISITNKELAASFRGFAPMSQRYAIDVVKHAHFYKWDSIVTLESYLRKIASIE